jgi:hypothetical protein
MHAAVFDYAEIRKRLEELEQPSPPEPPQAPGDEFIQAIQRDWFGMPLIMWTQVD